MTNNTNMDENDLKQVEDKLVQGLSKVKQCLINQSNELKFSIRKDVVSADLKNILTDNTDFASLKNAIENYITNLLKSTKEAK